MLALGVKMMATITHSIGYLFGILNHTEITP